MWIKCTNPATQQLRRDDLDDPVEFYATDTAQVPKAVGERLVEQYDVIEPTDDSDD